MKDLLRKIILSQQTEQFRAVETAKVPRSITKAIRKGLDSGLVKVITGPRRAGKSTAALQAVASQKAAYVNFEDERLLPLLNNDFGDTLVEGLNSEHGEDAILVFDEIQNFPLWQHFINRLHRLGRNIIITGSNSNLLSSELASSLTGRHLSFEVLPFSFAEFRLAKESLGEPKQTDEARLFLEFLTTGGYPEVVMKKAEGTLYLSTLFQAVLLKDIVSRYKIRNVKAFRDVISLYLASLGHRFSGRSIESALQKTVSINTINKFIGFAKEAYLIEALEMFSFKTKIRKTSDRKAYCLDNGMYRAVGGNSTDNRGQLLENLVFIELKRRGYTPNLDLFYLAPRVSTKTVEIDFYIKSKKELIQVCWDLSAPKTRERELRALITAANETKANKITIITAIDTFDFHPHDSRVSLLTAWDWLNSAG